MDFLSFLNQEDEDVVETIEIPPVHIGTFNAFKKMVEKSVYAVDLGDMVPAPWVGHDGFKVQIPSATMYVTYDGLDGWRVGFTGDGSLRMRNSALFFNLSEWDASIQVAYQEAVEDAEHAQQSFELLSQAPHFGKRGARQFISRDAVLTFNTEACYTQITASAMFGRAIQLDFGFGEAAVYDFLWSMLDKTAWSGKRYTVNSFITPASKYTVVLTAPESVAYDSPYVTIWWDTLVNSSVHDELQEYVRALISFYRGLKEWATRYAAQLDCTIGDAYQAYEEHITSLPE